MFRTGKIIWNHRHALSSQFVVDIKTTVATTKLGPLWWILDPLVLMAIYTFMIKIVFDRGGPNYHIFALCGIVTWQSFARALNLSTGALRKNSSLIRQTSLPLQIYVLIPSIVQAFFYLIGLVIVACWNNSVLGWHTFAVLPLLLPMILLPFGLGLFLSVCDVYLSDTGKFLPYILRMGFYMSPVLYSVERINTLQNVPEVLKTLYNLNPMVHILSAVRDVLFIGNFFNFETYFYVLVFSFVVVQLGIIFFNRQAPEIPKAL